jgi:hypothetical protein
MGSTAAFFLRPGQISDQKDEQHPEAQQQQVLQTLRFKNIDVGE